MPTSEHHDELDQHEQPAVRRAAEVGSGVDVAQEHEVADVQRNGEHVDQRGQRALAVVGGPHRPGSPTRSTSPGTAR